jgi:hypothetical protein
VPESFAVEDLGDPSSTKSVRIGLDDGGSAGWRNSRRKSIVIATKG